MAPNLFISSIRQIPGIERGLVILGQCFAGTFDTFNATAKPELGVIGAAKLQLSFSSPVSFGSSKNTISNKTGKTPSNWAANVFLFHFFDWIRSPSDIDGDGKITFLDGFKYASAKANLDLGTAKIIASLDLDDSMENARQKIKGHVSTKKLLSKIDIVTASTDFDDRASILYLHQEPWILHAHLIRSTIIL